MDSKDIGIGTMSCSISYCKKCHLPLTYEDGKGHSCLESSK